jgi:hypothetical protein
MFKALNYKGFLNDLRKIENDLKGEILEIAYEPNSELVAQLELELSRMQREAKEKIKGKLIKWKEDADNPVFSEVSLYGSIDCGRLEVAHTNTLAWLLDPKGRHGFDVALLKSLLTNFDNEQSYDEYELCATKVASEEFVKINKKTGRIDVWAEGVWKNKSSGEQIPWLMIIECKIDNNESDGQLTLYELYANEWLSRNENGNILFIFITPDRNEGKTSQQRWETLSYEDLVVLFWSRAKFLKNCAGYHFLRLYLAGLLKDVQGWPIPLTETTDSPYKALLLFDRLSFREEVVK